MCVGADVEGWIGGRTEYGGVDDEDGLESCVCCIGLCLNMRLMVIVSNFWI